MSTIKNITKKITLLFVMGALAACGGGGSGSGNVSTGGVYLTHSQLAADFVHRLNIDAGYDVTLVKTHTLQSDYIVVYDHDYGTYDAYDLDYYNPGENINSYLALYDNNFYFDLLPSGFGSYTDEWSGLIFEKTEPTSKDRLKMAALEEGLMIKKASDVLNVQFGLSQERSFEVAKLAVIWQKTPKERMSDADHDQFAKEVLGHTISEYKGAVAKKLVGNGSELNQLIQDTATLNGVTPEQMNQVLDNVFGVSIH